MKQIISSVLLMLVFAFCTSQANAQSWLNRMGDRVKDKVLQKTEDRIIDNVGKGMDATFDATEDAVVESVRSDNSDKEDKKAKKEKKNKKQQVVEDDDDDDYDEQPQPKASSKSSKGEAAAAEPTKAAEMAYAKSDFVAGDEIIFDDQMDGEKLGEFPSQWDLIGGTAEVASIDGKKAICFVENGDKTEIEPLMKNPKAYLPEIFTIEFDFFIIKNKLGNTHYHLYLVGDVMDRTNKDLLRIDMYAKGDGEYAAVKPDMSEVDGKFDLSDGIKEGDWNHFALSFNKRACKAYINGVRYVNIPNMQAPKRFRITGSWWNDTPTEYITNIRIAQGAVPLYDRMMTDGKFITYGITFDVGKSVIKPESMGEITRIVQLMNENPTLKFSVEGHTDATGNAASNQTLSEARAKAIVDKLVENGISADRLTAVGKGQNSPIADNSTDEGRAKNRRVEFVKMQ